MARFLQERAAMKEAPKEYRRTRIVVAGKGHFPAHMLSYDNCVPDTEKDVILIEGFSTLPRQVSLSRFTLDGAKANAERWESFGWRIIFDDGA